MQLDEPDRGFSFRDDGPLDMRMGGAGPTAAEIVNTASEERLADIFHYFGEERAARRIAGAIAHDREVQPFTTTGQLARLIARIAPNRQSDIHPATKSFQALRIAVNDELAELVEGLCAAERALAPEGRLAVVTFHSLEDRWSSSSLRRARDAARRNRVACRASPRRSHPPFGSKGRSPDRRSPKRSPPSARALGQAARRRAHGGARPGIRRGFGAARTPAGPSGREELAMLRLFNLLSILVLLGSAVYAYSIKYQTSFRTEQIAKAKLEIKTEQDGINVLRAEWAFLTRPERVQKLSERYLDLEPLALAQIDSFASLPERLPHADAIGDKLDMLGLGVASTPSADPAAAPATPRTRAAPQPKQRRPQDDDRVRDSPPPSEKRLSRTARLGRMLRGLFSTSLDLSVTRMRLVAFLFFGIYALICGRLVYLGLKPDPATLRRAAADAVAAARPDLLDRNGEILAADVKTMSVFAEPRRLSDKDEATELLTATLPVDAKQLRERLGSRKGFVWVKREVTPHQRDEVFHLGLAGVGLLAENKRIYPNGPLAAHVLGFADTDNIGVAGMEKYVDGQGLANLHVWVSS